MNLSAILAELYRRTDQPASPGTAVVTRFQGFVNTTHRQILGTPGFDTLRTAPPLTFASVANQSRYGLPPAVSRIDAIVDRTTALKLKQVELSAIREEDPAAVNTGPADRFAVRGYQQVQTQPTAATGLWAVCSANDTTTAVNVETVRTGGYRYTGTATLNGTTRVQIGTVGTFTDHIEVDKFYLTPVGTASIGTVSLYDAAAAGNELARIAIGGTFARYLTIVLYPTPASVITYYVDYVRDVPDIVNVNDEPLLPQDFHYLLVEGALIKEWTKANDADRRAMAEKDFAKGMSALKYYVNCPPDFLPSRGGSVMERSRFGANFPATRG